MKIKKCLEIALTAFIVFSLIGCDAFVRKFTRKRKEDPNKYRDMVVAPEEYLPPNIPAEEKYRQTYFFWKAWQDELVQSLMAVSINRKKQLDCLDEAVRNLSYLKPMLNELKQKQLEGYIARFAELRKQISWDSYGANASWNRAEAERLRRDIIRELSLPRVKKYLMRP